MWWAESAQKEKSNAQMQTLQVILLKTNVDRLPMQKLQSRVCSLDCQPRQLAAHTLSTCRHQQTLESVPHLPGIGNAGELMRTESCRPVSRALKQADLEARRAQKAQGRHEGIGRS